MLSGATDAGVSVALVGLGSVGVGYDLELPHEEYALTHASAITANPNFTLIAGVDHDPARRSAFELRYGVAASATIGDIGSHVDLVVIATSTPTHLSVATEAVLELRPRVVLIEKPMCASADEARSLLTKSKPYGVRFFVNYHRVAADEYAQVGARLKSDFPYSGVAWYSKGVRNNASHLIHLLTRWLGPATFSAVVRRDERGVEDPEPDFVAQFGDVPVVFMAARGGHYSVFSVELMTPNGVIRLDGPSEAIFERRVRDDPDTPGYRVLDSPTRTLASDQRRTMAPVYASLARASRDELTALATAAEAIAVQDVIDQVVAANT